MTDEQDSTNPDELEALFLAKCEESRAIMEATYDVLNPLTDAEFALVVMAQLAWRMCRSGEPLRAIEDGSHEVATTGLLAVLGLVQDDGQRALAARLGAVARGTKVMSDGTIDESPAALIREASKLVELFVADPNCEDKAGMIAYALGHRFGREVPIGQVLAMLRDRDTPLGRATDAAMILGLHRGPREAVQRAAERALARRHNRG